jgi:hypothetical protein
MMPTESRPGVLEVWGVMDTLGNGGNAIKLDDQ